MRVRVRVRVRVRARDEHGPAAPPLCHTDPYPYPYPYPYPNLGTHTRFDAKAIGAGAEGAQTALQAQYHKNLTPKP